MKKLVALLISFALLITVFPFGVSAVTDDQQRNSLLNEKAASVFPEYADKILNPDCRVSTNTRSKINREIVVNETRTVSDYEYLTYTEYSDGLILLNDCDFYAESEGVNTVTGVGYRQITANVTAWCVSNYYDGYFYLDNITYRLNDGDNNFDTIINPGTPRKGQNCTTSIRSSYTQDESNSGYAKISYSLVFKTGSGAKDTATSNLAFYVGEDTASVSHTAVKYS